HIFDRFYRGKDSDAPGSGLGLAIVQGIVQAHGGTVAVVSGLGQGSRFTVELPERDQA
ncbi:MAG: HAMP domain-containing histidine kinase, partial [Anaerolineae bacterium]|nr:HAMP domain-containing histidine kinase [Anaerolineae bacterium]